MAKSVSSDSTIRPWMHPWGVINDENRSYLEQRPVPAGFRAKHGAQVVSSADAWDRWLDKLSLEMADWLWPVFEAGAWRGAAQVSMWELTVADLELIGELSVLLNARVQGNAHPGGRHRELWQAEDETAPGPTLVHYQAELLSVHEAEFNRAVMAGAIATARPMSQGLKRRFQRPRPQQTSLWLGRNDLTVMASKSAITPAMISGHCVQSTLALGKIFVALQDVMAEQPVLHATLPRYLLDHGDRRVYAGLHYPSDNVGSWYAALRLCPHVFGSESAAVRDFLWKSITAHSDVYRALLAVVSSNPKSPFAPLLNRLREAAGQK